MMFDIDKLKIALKVLPISEEKKSEVITKCEIIVDFRKFISEKNSCTEEQADSIINGELAKLFGDEKNLPINEVVKIALNNSFEYSKSEGYSNPSGLRDAIECLYTTLSIL